MKGNINPPEETIKFALNESHTVYLTMKYFVDDCVISTAGKCMNTEKLDPGYNGKTYRNRDTCYTPLIGGERAFSVLQDALEGATKTIDYICWGFQPSMYFKRKRSAAGIDERPLVEADMIGSVLERIAARGVKVRILSWYEVTAQSPEPNLPGFGGQGLSTNYLIPYATPQQSKFDQDWHQRVINGKMPNITVRTRSFSLAERARIATYLNNESSDAHDLLLMQSTALTLFPTHHQKMVLIDYETPERAVGFVMGHNSTSKYWSAPPYSVQRYRPDEGRDGNIPYHDNSAMITGPLLYDLNDNFSQAWDKDEPGNIDKADHPHLIHQPVAGRPLEFVKSDDKRQTVSLRQSRAHIVAEQIPLESNAAISRNGAAGHSYLAHAQICRTQPQHNVRNIEVAYLQAVMQIGRVIYFENQYFRFAPLIETMKKNLIKKREWGGTKPLYVFVVTNSTAPVEESQKDGSTNTYRMLAALGREDTMPERARQKEIDALQAQIAEDSKYHPSKIAEDKAKLMNAKHNPQPIQRKDFGPIRAVVCTLVCPDHGKQFANPYKDKAQKLAESKTRLKNLQSQENRLYLYLTEKTKMHGRATPEERAALKNLNEQIREEGKIFDQLKALPGPPPALKKQDAHSYYKPIWTPVYVHSKTTIIDDAVIIQGSANLNVRSMEVDSELNIVVQDYAAAQTLRRDLWRIHAGEKGAVDNEVLAFTEWESLIEKNKDQEAILQPPVASIIGFYDTQKSWGTLD